MRCSTVAALLILMGNALPIFGQGDERIRFAETFGKDYQYHVSCQVEIKGVLPVPQTAREGIAKTLQVSGKSTLRYDERILRLTPERRVDRTIRQYQNMEFQRKVGTEEQQNQLRPEVRRLVILRQNQYEVPFCPRGPLTWGEIELVRTDVFVPALTGLFPGQPVRPGDQWRADNVAIQELTDLDKIDRGELTCTFEKITTLLGKRTAHVRFEGKVQGIGEDGSARHELRGTYYFDVDANFLTYLYVQGTHHLLGKDGAPAGKIEGTFVMTRSPTPSTKELSDESLRGVELEPNADNMLLLFDHPQLGLRFLYPRNWRIAGSNNRQVGIDEDRGSGMLITLSPGATTPTGAQFHQETLQWLDKQKAKLSGQQRPRQLQPGLETFLFEGEIDQQKVVLQYFVVRQGNYGATMAARLTRAHVSTTQRDIERMARSLQLSAPK